MMVMANHYTIALVKVLFSIQKYWYFSYFSTKTCCGYSLEVPRQGTPNEYPQHMFSRRNKKKYIPDTLSYLDLWNLHNARYKGEGGGWFIIQKNIFISTQKTVLWIHTRTASIYHIKLIPVRNVKRKSYSNDYAHKMFWCTSKKNLH